MHIGFFIVMMVVSLGLSILVTVANCSPDPPPKKVTGFCYLAFLFCLSLILLFAYNNTEVIVSEHYSESEIKDGILTDVILYEEDLTNPSIKAERDGESKTAESYRINLNKRFSRDFEPGTKFERYYQKWGWLYSDHMFREVSE